MSEAQRRLVDGSFAQSETDTPFRSFKHMAACCDVPIGDVGPAARDLRVKGLMVFEAGLTTDEGEFYGSGYALSPLGLAVRDHLRSIAEGSDNDD